MADIDQDMADLYATCWLESMEEEGNRKRSEFFSKYWPGILKSLKTYLMETKTTRLNLRRTGIEAEELKSILTVLKESEVTELDLTENCFEFQMETLSKLLAKTKLKKLNISHCDLVDDDVLYLMRALKDSQITHLELSDMDNASFEDDKSARKFASYILKSRLEVLIITRLSFFSKAGLLPFIQALPSSSITQLQLSQISDLSSESLACLFSNLPATSITCLDLSSNRNDNEITFDKLKPIGRSLKNSKLKKLDLSGNAIRDKGVDLLAESLPFCKLISLNLTCNGISGANHLGQYLKGSKIEDLNLNDNLIVQSTMFSFPDFVKDTAVTTLGLGSCRLGDELGKELMKSLEGSVVSQLDVKENNFQYASISEFSRIVKNTVIEDVNFSGNFLSSEALLILGDALKGSRIKRIDISYNCKKPEDIAALSALIEKTKDTLVNSLQLSGNHIDASGAEIIAASLPNTTFTEIDLSHNSIGCGVGHLAAQLKATAITHLNLSDNDIGDAGTIALAEGLIGSQVTNLNLTRNNIHDEGTIALAEALKETQVTELRLSHNCITSCGAKALAFSIKKSSLLCLELKDNKIDDEGFDTLAAQTENTLLNFFEAEHNELSEDMFSLLFTVEYFWKNRLLGHRLVTFFKTISPEVNSENLCFDRNLDAGNAEKFVEECIHFFKTVTELPAAISVLAEEESLPYSRKQITTLLKEEFPKQFTAFVDRKIKPDVAEFIKCLKKIEETGMIEILKPLLIKAPILRIDENVSIVHPFLYKLLLKYEQPFGNITVEPQNKMKVINYLAENIKIEGALDMIKILSAETLN